MPAYNEERRIRDTVITTAQTLSRITGSFEIIIAEDGSTDGTEDIASQLASEMDNVVHLHSDQRQGRGRALNRAFKTAKGDVLCYIDVDLATDMAHLSELIEAIRTQGYDFATGSRMMPSSDVKRPLKRGLASKGFNVLTRTMLGSKLYDHQCGFKAFKRESLFELLDSVEDEHWFWDTELLVRAQRAGYKVKEFPVRWRHGGATKVDLIKDVIGMGSQIVRLGWQLSAPHIGRKRKVIFTFILALLLLFLIFTLVGIEDVWLAAASASPPMFGLAVVVYLFSWPVRGIRYQHILRRLGHDHDLNFITGTIFMSQSANVILPARIGDVSRAYILKKEKDIPLTTGMSSLAVERIFDIIAITVIGVLSVLVVTTQRSVGNLVIPLILSSIAVIVLFFAGIFFLSSRGRNGLSPMERIILRFSRSGDYTDWVGGIAKMFIDEIYTVSSNVKDFIVVFFSSLVVWTIDILTCYIVLTAFPFIHNTASFTMLIAIVFLAVAVGNLAKMFPVTPGAIGTYEGSLTVVFGIAGIAGSVGVAAAVIDHMIKNSVTLVFGALYLTQFNIKWHELLDSKKKNK
ncbi:MAG: flippase-like domain-containing protein [ANME-2 cluster archaeon]|nr:flippase-like domain-containing protein [ANME-2 cluster archaeon]